MPGLRLMASVVAVVAGFGAAQAATLVGSQQYATGINNLIVDGKSYDVVFNTAPLNTVYPDPAYSFFSSAMSHDAVASIASFFNSSGVTGIVNSQTYEFNVPYENNHDGSFSVYESFNGGHDVGQWSIPSVLDMRRPGGNTNYDHNSVAVFSMSAVPLPASAPMFGAALLGLGIVGFRLKSKKAAAA